MGGAFVAKRDQLAPREVRCIARCLAVRCTGEASGSRRRGGDTAASLFVALLLVRAGGRGSAERAGLAERLGGDADELLVELRLSAHCIIFHSIILHCVILQTPTSSS